MAPCDRLSENNNKDPGVTLRTDRPIALFAPEHFYLFNTLAVPQLTGYLLERSYRVQSRVLDNEFYPAVADLGRLKQSLAELDKRQPAPDATLVGFLAESIATARIPQEFGFRAADPDQVLAGLLRHREAVARTLHQAETLLRERFLGLSKDRFLLALARLQLAVDLFMAPYWPSQFGVLSGLKMRCGTERSTAVLAATEDGAANPFLAYYRAEVVPSLPRDALLVGISITHEAQIIPAFTLARVIREHRPDLHVTLGGATVSTLRETLGADNPLWAVYDSLIVGAGEESLASLSDALAAGSEDLSKVPNLIWRAAGGITQNRVSSDFRLDQVATPVFNDPRPHPILPVATSTGCDWAKCRFCHYPRIFPGESQYCVRPVDAFIRDIEALTRQHQPTYFHLCDTNLAIGQIEALADAILKSGPRSRFYSFVRAEKAFTDLAFCRKVRRAGFFALHFGLESGSQTVLNRVRKGIHLQNVGKIIDNFDRADILANVFLMVGTPGETAEDIDKTVSFIEAHLGKLRGEVAVSRFYLDKHSDIYFHPEAFGIEIRPDPEADLDTDVPFHNPGGFNDEDMEALVEGFYARIGLPRSYGHRFFFEMLKRFCPDSLAQRIALYRPFIWGSVKRGLDLGHARAKRSSLSSEKNG